MDSQEHDGARGQSSTDDPRWFATTHWSVVALAGQPDSAGAAEALERLCRTYWPPLYTYVRCRGYGPHDAQDLTQACFAGLLKTNSFAGLARQKGKFRTFLLAALNHLLSDARDREWAEKRGGGRRVLSIDETEAEECYLQVPSRDPAPERAFDRRWAITVLEQALARLQQEQANSGREELFQHLRPFLSNEGSAAEYEIAGRQLGMTSGSVAVAVCRLRQRYRECIRLELAQTVATPEDLEAEMSYLFSVLSSP